MAEGMVDDGRGKVVGVVGWVSPENSDLKKKNKTEETKEKG